jgi:hypothetical protein
MNNDQPNDPLAPDAPIYHLLSIRENPLVKDMTMEQLQELVKRMRTMSQSPQTLTSALQRESKTRKSKPLTEYEIKRRAILADL